MATHSKDVFQSRLEQVSELFLGDEFKERGFERVRADVVEELHWSEASGWSIMSFTLSRSYPNTHVQRHPRNGPDRCGPGHPSPGRRRKLPLPRLRRCRRGHSG